MQKDSAQLITTGKLRISEVTRKGNAQKSLFDRSDIGDYRKNALRAAKELCYSMEIVKRIEEATTEGEIERAMKCGRQKFMMR